MKFWKLKNKEFIFSILLALNPIGLNSHASIYEAILSGTIDYDDATIELGLQDDSSYAKEYFGMGLSSNSGIDHLIFTYRGESTDFTNENSESLLSRVSISSGKQFQLSDHTDIDLDLRLRTHGISDLLDIRNYSSSNEFFNIYSIDNGYWTLTSFGLQSSDTGDATYSISGDTYAGSTLTAAVSTDDPDGNGTVTSYTWQSSSDGSTWSDISGATSSTYTVTSAEEGKYIIVLVSYTDGSSTSESVTASSITIPHVDSGEAEFILSGSTYAGKVLTASLSSSDPDGDGTFSYQWQSSTDGSTWTAIEGATSSTYTLTASEEGKYIRVSISYTDSEGFSESILVAIQGLTSQMHSEWLQPYAAMQNIGLKSIHNNRDLVLAKAGECNNSGWVIGDSDYCLYTNAKNKVSYVNGDTTKGSYGSAVFNSSLNLEKTLNDKWKAGIAYGVGSSNLYDFDFSSTTASLNSTNTHYSIYGVKKVNDTFTLKGMIGGSDFDYKGKRNYSTTSATSSYDSDGYTAEINGIWDIKKTIKNMKTPFRLKPSVGVAYAAHTQDGFSESGSGDLITIDANQAESLLFKTGISIDKQISMEGGKWLLVPSLALNYEMDTYADDSNRSIKGGLTESSTDHTSVSAKTFGQHNGSLEVGADFVLTKDFMFNLKAEYGLAEDGDEHAYGGGFRWQF